MGWAMSNATNPTRIADALMITLSHVLCIELDDVEDAIRDAIWDSWVASLAANRSQPGYAFALADRILELEADVESLRALSVDSTPGAVLTNSTERAILPKVKVKETSQQRVEYEAEAVSGQVYDAVRAYAGGVDGGRGGSDGGGEDRSAGGGRGVGSPRAVSGVHRVPGDVAANRGDGVTARAALAPTAGDGKGGSP
jgi:hypothetical protein